MKTWKNFLPEEFEKACPPCQISDMDADFMDCIQRVRSLSCIPMKINSAYRSPEYEHSKGRAGTSLHTLGRALDIHCDNSVTRYHLVSAALSLGELSLVIYPTFIHFDNRAIRKLMLSE